MEGTVCPRRPVMVLFGSSIVQYSFGHGSWGTTLCSLWFFSCLILLENVLVTNSRHAVQVLPTVLPKVRVIDLFSARQKCQDWTDTCFTPLQTENTSQQWRVR